MTSNTTEREPNTPEAADVLLTPEADDVLLTPEAADVLLTPEAADVLLTPEAVAKRLVVTVDKVERLARSGALGGKKVGRVWRFTEANVAAYLDSVDTTTAPAPIVRRPARRRAA